MIRSLTCFAALAGVAITSGCGTTYEVRAIEGSQLSAVAARHDAISAEPSVNRPDRDSVAMFNRVRSDVEPVAERFCVEETEAGTNCDYDIGVDPGRSEVNAYQTYVKGRPTLVFTPGFISQVGNDHELAYVMGHEAGHHIAGHLDKKETQTAIAAGVGATIGVAILIAAAASGAQPSEQDVENLVMGGGLLGAAAGSSAYSQTYELEADMIGAYIAEAAGYDPTIGSAVFPRIAGGDHPEPDSGQAAFWATHPSSPERLAWAVEVADAIAAARAAGETPTPPKAKELGERIAEALAF